MPEPAPYPEFTDADTLGEVRAFIRRAAREHGARCPACTQFARVYSRLLNANMARLLIMAFRAEGQAWFHVRALRDGTGDWAKLRYWGLVQETTERHLDGTHVGQWRITDRGVAFLHGRLQLPRYAEVYDGQLLGHAGAPIGIRDALGERFDYAALMATPAEHAPPAAGEPEPEPAAP